MAKDVAIFIFPGMTMMDAIAPHQMLGMMPDLNVATFAPTHDVVVTDTGMRIVPDHDVNDVPQPDILVVAGGGNVLGPISDEAVVKRIRALGEGAEYVTSVCTGALILAQAGLLDGYRATTHWGYMDLLRQYPGVEVTEGRVVTDRNRMTGGGITAGLDFSITLIKEVLGPEAAAAAELIFEYRPEPPMGTGHPTAAPPELVGYVTGMLGQVAAGLPEFVAAQAARPS